MNNIYQTENIPKKWQEGEIIRLYKGKGKKGKCSNERGITLSSNAGKLFERIINNRITKQVQITEAQAGGQKGKATADHLTIVNNIIKQHKAKKSTKPLHIALLDVTKAYDKAWLNAILYTLNKSGLKDKEWTLTRKLNLDLTATIRTKYGKTRPINIKDSIRQGGVLSVIEYANLMDEIAKELQKENKGNLKIGAQNIMGCLLWMDDVALIHHDIEELQQMLDITDEIAKRYHIKFGKAKSQILTIGKTTGAKLHLGDMELDQTNTYKYLGITLNNKGTMEDHITKTKGKVEAALQTIFNIAGNRNFNQIEMKTIWKLINTCIIPIIMYAAEIWTPTKIEIKQTQKILDNVLKRILLCPTTTPSECIQAETGIRNVETMMNEKQIMYLHHIINGEDNNTRKISLDESTIWNKQITNTLKKYNLEKQTISSMEKSQLKQHIKTAIHKEHEKYIRKAAESKSKVRHLLAYKPPNTLNKQAMYLKELTRTEAAAIFNTRARMLKTKTNYPNMFNDKTCRLCKVNEETQQHILEECPATNPEHKVNYTKTMENQKDSLKEEANKIIHIINLLKDTPHNTREIKKVK